MYLYLALFWLAVGVLAQIYWETLAPYAYIPVDRTILGFVFFVLFSYNFIRWRMARTLQQARQQEEELRHRPRAVQREYDPNLDFSAGDEKKDSPG